MNLIEEKNHIQSVQSENIITLEGIVKFSFKATSTIIKYLLNALNGRNIVSGTVFIKKEYMNKRIFDADIDIIDDPFIKSDNKYIYDDEGTKCSTKYLIKGGVLVNTLNNEKMKFLLNGTSGNCFIDTLMDDLSIKSTNTILKSNTKITDENDYDIYIEDINMSESVFDLQSGNFTFKLVGKYRNNHESNYFLLKYDIRKLLRNIKCSSNSRWVGNVRVPEIIVNIT